MQKAYLWICLMAMSASYDCSDSVQDSHWPHTDEAGNISDSPGGPGSSEVQDSNIPNQASEEGTIGPPEQAETEVAPVWRSTRVRRQSGWLSDYAPLGSLETEGMWE